MIPLLKVCDPLFRYICALNRLGRMGGPPHAEQVKDELEGIFSKMRSQADGAPGLAEQYEKVELPLMFFADAMVKNSNLPFALDWQDLAYERNELAGDDKFFELLDQTLRDRSPSADERLAVFYHCIGLGFTGRYTGDATGPEALRRTMKKIEDRIRRMMETDDRRVTPEAYKYTNTENLYRPPSEPVTRIVLVLVALLVVLVGTNIMVYRRQTREVRDTLTHIQGTMEKRAADVAKE